ncbi:MAG: ADP-ribosylglycohydrolase family protein, partial [Candidatus Brocadiaceae bacterium]
RVEGLLPYEPPLTLIEIQPGYALHPEPGCVTDDTFIRAQFTRFFLKTSPPRTPAILADWLLENADFDCWWPPMTESLQRIEAGEVDAERAGREFREGGGVGWWTPVPIIHAGDPGTTAEVCRRLSVAWKGPLEQDLLAGVQAAVAVGIPDGASVGSMLEALRAECGPTATQLVERAIRIAGEAEDFGGLVATLYENVLIADPPVEADDPLPPPLDPLPDSDEAYVACYFAEQVPLAVAAFLFAQGSPAAIGTACSLGRDADSVATLVGSWVGALHGETGLPTEWVETVCAANQEEVDLRDLAERIAAAPP